MSGWCAVTDAGGASGDGGAMSTPLAPSGGDVNHPSHRCSLSPPLAPSGGDSGSMSPPLGGRRPALRIARVYISLYIQHARSRSPAPPGAHNACGVETRACHMPPPLPSPHPQRAVCLADGLGKGWEVGGERVVRGDGCRWEERVRPADTAAHPQPLRRYHAVHTCMSTCGARYGCTRCKYPCNKGVYGCLRSTRIQGSHSMSQHVMCVTHDVTHDVTRAPKGTLRISPGITPVETGTAAHGPNRPKYTPNTPINRGFYGYLLYTRIQCSHSMSCVSLMMSPTMSPAHQKGHSGYHPESHLLSHVRLLQG